MVPSATQAFWGFGEKQTEMCLTKILTLAIGLHVH